MVCLYWRSIGRLFMTPFSRYSLYKAVSEEGIILRGGFSCHFWQKSIRLPQAIRLPSMCVNLCHKTRKTFIGLTFHMILMLSVVHDVFPACTHSFHSSWIGLTPTFVYWSILLSMIFIWLTFQMILMSSALYDVFPACTHSFHSFWKGLTPNVNL